MSIKDGLNELSGLIFKYTDRVLISYKNNVKADLTIVFLGGLGDSILSLDLVADIDEFCREKSYSFVIPQLTSHPNYRMVTIDQDIEDIHDLLKTIDGKVILIGHSTGCQDALLYLEKYNNKKIKGIILQAAVSDIECLTKEQQMINKEIIKNFDRNSSKFEDIGGSCWLKERFISLYSPYGKEDLFSSYLEIEKYQKWKNFDVKIMTILSGSDEFCKEDNIKNFKIMSQVNVIDGADHCLSYFKHRSIFINHLAMFLKEILII